MQAAGRPPQRAPDGASIHYERHRPEQTTLYRLVQQHAAVFLRHARAVITAAAEAMQAPHYVRHDMTGVLKLACTHTVAGYYLPPLLARFHRQYPGIQVELVEMTRTRIEESLISGEAEVALCLISPLN